MTDKKIEGVLADQRIAGEFMQFIVTLPALFWTYHLDSKSIVFLNSCTITPLERQEEKFLKDLVFAQSICVPQDFFRLKLFIQAMRQGQAALSIVRVTDNQGRLYWLKLYGAPLDGEPGKFFGYVMEVTESISTLHFLMQKELEAEAVIEQFDYPVILAEFDTLKLLSRNSQATETLSFGKGNFRQKTLPQLLVGENKDRFTQIYETCLTEGKWEGLLAFAGNGDDLVWGDVVLKKLQIKSKELLKLSIFNARNTPESPTETGAADPGIRKKVYIERLCQKLSAAGEPVGVLQALLENQFYPGSYEALMMLVPSGKKIRVHLAGKAFQGQNPTAISEFVQPLVDSFSTFGEDFRIVGDTFDSTDPIDWALFIPSGIRSYFIKPLYGRQKLKGVLVLCSSASNAFSPDDIETVSLLDTPLKRALFSRKPSKKE